MRIDLGNPKNTIEIIQKYNFAFQKKFGQNFLIDTHVLSKIITAAGVTKDDMVLEIGPGIVTVSICDLPLILSIDTFFLI